jgi:hypothetical protein
VRIVADMTPIEAAQAAQELADRLLKLAALDSRPTTNAEAIYTEWAESKDLITSLAGHIDLYAATA